MLNAIEIVAAALTAKQIREVRKEAQAKGKARLAVACYTAVSKQDPDALYSERMREQIEQGRLEARRTVAAYILNGTLPG
jgi:LAS superfamily LD-carboxypeptidase LdcB